MQDTYYEMLEGGKMNIQQRKLFIVYNRAIAKAKRSPDAAKIIQRLHKALGIIQSHNYYIAEKSKYEPTRCTCGCDDWKYHNAAKRQYHGHCKHMMAEILMSRIQELKYRQLSF